MAKYYGKIGYGKSVEDPPNSGIWVEKITEVLYFGDVDRDVTQLGPGIDLNDDISISNTISVVADDYLNNNFADIKYVEWAGTLWTLKNVEVQRPRLVLSLGKVYNGPTA